MENGLYLGIELGSTRIKAVLIDGVGQIIAAGAHDWENRLVDGLWTYDMGEVWDGVRSAYRRMAEEYSARQGRPLTRLDGLGISAMMHGYLVFDENDRQLVPFRTWRNTITGEAAAALTEAFRFNIPQRWSVAHLYQAVLGGEPHVEHIRFITTLAGYVHWKLTGRRVLGVGEASGMFPLDESGDFDAGMLQAFAKLSGVELAALLPAVLPAGQPAGLLTAEGAALLDPAGALEPGVRLCPPEGDAGTGMVATNSITPRTGNVSAGTSIFAMLVLEKPLSSLYPEIDIVATPSGKPVAMVHCNNCTSELDSWVKLLGEAAGLMGANFTKPALYDALYELALTAEPDAGGLLGYNYVSGEHLTQVEAGRPMLVRGPESRLTLANFMRAQLFSAMATLKLGMDILSREQVRLTQLLGHGGLFKTPVVGQRLMASALNVPMAVMESAGEGGAWGMALLAAYCPEGHGSLEDFLGNTVFANMNITRVDPNPQDAAGFSQYLERYRAALPLERQAGALVS